jgi:hypothetical protein
MNIRKIRHLQPPNLLRHEFLGLLRPFTEQEFLHFSHQERPRLGLDRGESVLVDEHGLVRHPGSPAFLGNAVVDAPAEVAGIRLIVQPFRILLQVRAMNRA